MEETAANEAEVEMKTIGKTEENGEKNEDLGEKRQKENAEPPKSEPDTADGNNSAKEDNAESDWLNWKALAVLLLVYVLYIILGGIIFHLIEYSNEQRSITEHGDWIEQFLDNYTCISEEELSSVIKVVMKAYDQGIFITNNDTDSSDTSWDIASSIFFSTTIVTTIGYGNIAPATAGGRVFTVFYAIIGIPLFVVASGQLGMRLSKYSSKLAKKVGQKINNEKARAILAPLVVFSLGFVVFSLSAAAVFSAAEGWRYADSVYYTFITLTTIGLGDYYPSYAGGGSSSPLAVVYRLFVSVWILCGLVWMASMISGTSDSLMSTIMTKVGKDKVNHTDAADGRNKDAADVKA